MFSQMEAIMKSFIFDLSPTYENVIWNSLSGFWPQILYHPDELCELLRVRSTNFLGEEMLWFHCIDALFVPQLDIILFSLFKTVVV